MLWQNHARLGSDTWLLQGTSGSSAGLHPSQSESSAGRWGRAPPALAGSRVMLLTGLTVKEKLEKALLGIWLDGLLFLKGCIAGAEGAGSSYCL